MPEGFCGKSLNPDGELPFFTRCAFRIHPRRTNYRIDGQRLYSCAGKNLHRQGPAHRLIKGP